MYAVHINSRRLGVSYPIVRLFSMFHFKVGINKTKYRAIYAESVNLHTTQYISLCLCVAERWQTEWDGPLQYYSYNSYSNGRKQTVNRFGNSYFDTARHAKKTARYNFDFVPIASAVTKTSKRRYHNSLGTSLVIVNKTVGVSTTLATISAQRFSLGAMFSQVSATQKRNNPRFICALVIWH